VLTIQNESNVGLGTASNQGIKATRGRYVLLLNNDTLVNGKSLDAMVAFMEAHPRVGAVGGQLLNPDGSVQACYNNFTTLKEEFFVATRLGEQFRDGYPAVIKDDKVGSVDWLGSACLMLRRDMLRQVGMLDEEYFIYGDELDLQYRMKKAGWEIYYLPHVTTIHYGGRSMERWPRRRMVYRGKILFYRKNYGTVRAGALRLMLAGLSLAKIVCWGLAYLVPSVREKARRELYSNLDVLELCWKLA
jgi:GT2 family glycosyltransferase